MSKPKIAEHTDRDAKVVAIGLTQIGDDRRVAAALILKKAKREKLDEVLVIGRTDKGELWAKSSLNTGQSLYLLEKLKQQLLDCGPWGIV